jgi:hypothetical protein
MVVDLLLHWEEAAQLVKETGFDGWLKFVHGKFPYHKLYSASTDWYTHGPEYIAKLRGTCGDVIVGWKKWWKEAREMSLTSVGCAVIVSKLVMQRWSNAIRDKDTPYQVFTQEVGHIHEGQVRTRVVAQDYRECRKNPSIRRLNAK